MREGWEVKSLKDVCLKTNNLSWKDNSDKNFQYIDLSAVSRETLTITESSEVDKDNAPSRAKKIINTNDVIFATTRPTLNRMAIVPSLYNNQICSTGFVVLRANTDMVLAEYIFYSLQEKSFMNKMEELQRGASYPAVSDNDVKNFEIPIPPLPEQKQIVKTLDLAFGQIDQAKANLEQNLANAKELFASKLNEVFSQRGEGWEEKRLGDVCETGSGGTPLKSKKEYYENGTIPWLCSGEVKQGDIYQSKQCITEIGLKNSSAKLFPPNTVLIAMYGATAGEVGILRFESSTNQAICGILPNDDLLPKFIYYSFLFRQKELIAQATGNAQPNISQIKIKNTLIPLLEKSKQIEIIDLLDSLQKNIDVMIAHYQQNLNNLEELKKSILEKAFKGEL